MVEPDTFKQRLQELVQVNPSADTLKQDSIVGFMRDADVAQTKTNGIFESINAYDEEKLQRVKVHMAEIHSGRGANVNSKF